MSITARWETGPVTSAWRPTPQAAVSWMLHGSREVLRVQIPDLDLERTEVYMAVIPAGFVPEPAEWRPAVYADGVAMLLHTASDLVGTYAVWVRIRSGIETVLRIAATLAVLEGPDTSGVTPLPPDAGSMPARIPSRIGDPGPRSVDQGGAGIPSHIPGRLGEQPAGEPGADPGTTPEPTTGAGGMPSEMPSEIGSGPGPGSTPPATGTNDGAGAMPATMPASLA